MNPFRINQYVQSEQVKSKVLQQKLPMWLRLQRLNIGFGHVLSAAMVTLVASVFLLTGCPQAQTAVNQLQPAVACIVNAAMIDGFNDPLAIVQKCGGVTLADIIQVIESLLANQPDAGAPTVDGGSFGASPDRIAHLQDLLAKAKAAQAVQAGSK